MVKSMIFFAPRFFRLVPKKTVFAGADWHGKTRGEHARPDRQIAPAGKSLGPLHPGRIAAFIHGRHGVHVTREEIVVVGDLGVDQHVVAVLLIMRRETTQKILSWPNIGVENHHDISGRFHDAKVARAAAPSRRAGRTSRTSWAA